MSTLNQKVETFNNKTIPLLHNVLSGTKAFFNAALSDGDFLYVGDSTPPSGAAGGVLSGTYPNPGFAADMATQAELNSEAALARNADNLTSGTVDIARLSGVEVSSAKDAASGYAGLDASTLLKLAEFPPGTVVGYARTVASTGTTTTATIPGDDTIPQVGEGAEFSDLTTAYTVKFASSLLEIEMVCSLLTASAITNMIVALFRDGGADAIGACLVGVEAVGRTRPVVLRAIVAAGATGSTSITVRWGPSTAVTGGFLVTSGGVSVLSTSDTASLTIKEIKQ